MSECKSCSRLQELANLNELELIEEQLSLEFDLVSEVVKEKRLNVCLSCPFLKGQTCSKCGCYALFRTSLANKKCPINKWD
ncbi:hypothetical protein GCM10008932_01270 [Alkalibacterium iburiense]|uniref:Uncharacterized protein n=1 Tax=Alkalibacterium iburiense TaxID=290589 RepID=A0ABN0X1F8_9LACT